MINYSRSNYPFKGLVRENPITVWGEEMSQSHAAPAQLTQIWMPLQRDSCCGGKGYSLELSVEDKIYKCQETLWCWKGPHEDDTSLGTWFDLPGSGPRCGFTGLWAGIGCIGGCKDTRLWNLLVGDGWWLCSSPALRAGVHLLRILSGVEEDLTVQADIYNLQCCHFSMGHCTGDS